MIFPLLHKMGNTKKIIYTLFYLHISIDLEFHNWFRPKIACHYCQRHIEFRLCLSVLHILQIKKTKQHKAKAHFFAFSCSLIPNIDVFLF